ncbi:TolB family protein [Archangium primigenium]|uniref:TolB family protein n=1 Tax=[Archangium] primigenium TaxID=2792470 RepID=UPI00195ABD82|nr:hypothetical protein [Archangium primigenium]MBM7115691.1 hypothetical protein [Archangium primigenium]
MIAYSRIRWAAGVLAVWLLSGCAQEERAPSSPNEAPADSGQQKAPFDVQKVMDQVHFAFRPEGSAWEGGHSTYAVRVEANGFSVTPYHYPRSTSERSEATRLARDESRAREPEAPLHEAHLEGEPVRFGTAQVNRGGTPLSSHEATGQVQELGSLLLARSAVAEHFRNGKDGVEQSWSFEQKPLGAGDLEVQVPVKHGRFLGETAQGLHFASGSTGLGVRYGHGTWVDAAGQRTAVPARFEVDRIVLSVSASVVEGSSYPAVLDPIVSPEIGMDDPVYGPADNSQSSPAIAHNGKNFLVVWHDYRSNNYDIYGARVSNSGVVLDATGIRVSNALNEQSFPVVTHDGTNFLVVWQDYRNGGYDIYGARVSNAGIVLDTNGIPISSATNSQTEPAVTHDGTNFLVVWQDYRNGGHDIYAARVSNAGIVLDSSGIPISTYVNHQTKPAVASNGTNSLVVWQDTRSGGTEDIYGARVSNTGSVLNPNGILISTAVNRQESPAVAYSGTEFLVVWQDYRSGTNYDIYGARVSSTGVVRNPSGIPISTATNHQMAPALAKEGTNFLVVWQDTRSYDIYGARVNSVGAVLDTNGILVSTASSSAHEPALASDGTSSLVVWHDYSYINGPNIYGARVSSAGTVLDTSDISISKSGNGQYTPTVASDGTNYLVVWHDTRHGNSALYGARVNEMGTVLDTSGIPLATSGYSRFNPKVAYGGTSYLIVWCEYRSNTSYDIYGARVSSDGMVLDTTGIPISSDATSQYDPTVAYDGANFLVVWREYNSNTNNDIRGARVSSNGAVLDTNSISISTASNDQHNPVVAFNGTNFLVAWLDYRIGSGAIYGARVSSSGTVLDANGIPIATTTSGKGYPSITHNGLYFLVAWEEARSSTGSDIYGARVSSGGTVLDASGISISAAISTQSAPVVAYDGANFLVVWQDYRGGTGFSDIYGARVNELGKVVDTNGFPIATAPENEREPVVTSMGGETSLVVYRRSNPSPSTNSERVMARLVEAAEVLAP